MRKRELREVRIQVTSSESAYHSHDEHGLLSQGSIPSPVQAGCVTLGKSLNLWASAIWGFLIRSFASASNSTRHKLKAIQVFVK